MTRLEIRNLVDCPTCSARAGHPCFFTGKGDAKKNRAGANHAKRMFAAQGSASVCPADELIDEGDVIEVTA